MSRTIPRFSLAQWAAIAGIVGAIVAIIMLLIMIRGLVGDVGREVEEVEGTLDRVEEQVRGGRFTISFPRDGDSVDLTSIVRGETPYADMNHYLLVTPAGEGIDYIQAGRLRIYSGGSWHGRAGFGGAGAGAGEQFIIRAMATSEEVGEGPLTDLPPDALFSGAVTVTRMGGRR